MFDFTDQIVIITGVSGNLGRAVADAFAAAGASLVLPDRAPDRLLSLFPNLDAEKHFLASSVDVTPEDDVARQNHEKGFCLQPRSNSPSNTADNDDSATLHHR